MKSTLRHFELSLPSFHVSIVFLFGQIKFQRRFSIENLLLGTQSLDPFFLHMWTSASVGTHVYGWMVTLRFNSAKGIGTMEVRSVLKKSDKKDFSMKINLRDKNLVFLKTFQCSLIHLYFGLFIFYCFQYLSRSRLKNVMKKRLFKYTQIYKCTTKSPLLRSKLNQLMNCLQKKKLLQIFV